MEGLTAYEYHKKRNNLLVYSLIQRFSAATKIINIWKKYWFIKNYVPPKNFKIKTQFMNEFKLLPPSECGLFPGGIEYQNAYDDFKSISQSKIAEAIMYLQNYLQISNFKFEISFKD